MRLSGKRAVATGAANGIGEAIARRFVAERAAVLLADIDADRLHAVAESIGQPAFATQGCGAAPKAARAGTRSTT